ncbi:hypothetical protein GCM10009662_15180 [Catellatospora coxensis]|uniref:Uncharacterized protein n=1 Tax=Catellatospora coxensis TaxID=310354 RepID=A0A8J3KTM1_9ACTN|nr:hypothetical protein Cco03nite_50930 [Catellatospora coxensis]
MVAPYTIDSAMSAREVMFCMPGTVSYRCQVAHYPIYALAPVQVLDGVGVGAAGGGAGTEGGAAGGLVGTTGGTGAGGGGN